MAEQWPDPWPEGRPAPAGHELVISKDVLCPWCNTERGEDCWDHRDGRSFRMSGGRGHLARVKPVPIQASTQEVP